MSKNELNAFEKKALYEALSGDEPWKATLREQIPKLSVSSRVDTVIGGHIHFSIDDTCEPAKISTNDEGYPPTADVSHTALSHGGGVVVWTHGGKLSMLEYYANSDDVWPKHDGAQELAQFSWTPGC